MDIAVNLVESYLRLNGYLTLSEFEVQARNDRGEFESVTDVDIAGIRFPGSVYAGDPHGPDAAMLAIEDPALELEDGVIDVIIGEVKQGLAEFNPGLRRHEVLHSVLRRMAWLFDSDIEAVVHDLMAGSLCRAPARGGGTIRVRLVAFGRSNVTNLHTIGHAHVVSTMMGFLSGLDSAFHPVQFSAPAPAMLNLLLKTGFTIAREGTVESPPI